MTKARSKPQENQTAVAINRGSAYRKLPEHIVLAISDEKHPQVQTSHTTFPEHFKGADLTRSPGNKNHWHVLFIAILPPAWCWFRMSFSHITFLLDDFILGVSSWGLSCKTPRVTVTVSDHSQVPPHFIAKAIVFCFKWMAYAEHHLGLPGVSSCSVRLLLLFQQVPAFFKFTLPKNSLVWINHSAIFTVKPLDASKNIDDNGSQTSSFVSHDSWIFIMIPRSSPGVPSVLPLVSSCPRRFRHSQKV